MKKIPLYIIFILAIFNIDFVFADEPSAPLSWFGDASGFATGTANNGKTCGATDLCFGGRGLYIKLLKYEYTTKSVQVVGTPILLYNGSFLDDTKVMDTLSSDAKFLEYSSNWYWDSWSNGCVRYRNTVYGYEEITTYQKKNIKYCANGGSCGSVTVKHDPSLPSITNGEVPDYIKSTLLSKYAGTLDQLYSSFKLGAGSIDMANIDKYYLSFEPATRTAKRTNTDVISAKEETTKFDPTKGYQVGTATYTYKCSVTGKTKTTSGYKPTSSCSTTETVDCTEEGAKTRTDGTCYKVKEGSWNFSKCGSIQYIFVGILKTKMYDGISKIVPARSTSKTSLLRGLVTGNKNVGHCVLDKNNACTGQYEYYIGPMLKTAMVGTTSDNLYQLYDMSGEGKDIDDDMVDDGVAVGVSYWWVPGIIKCDNICGGKNGDDLLKCAENFCDNKVGYDDRANTQKLKAQCITSECGYEYVPTSCSNSNPYLNAEGTNNSVSATSICNHVGGGSTLSEDNIRTITSCVSDKTDIVNPADSATSNDIFDAKTYINIACKESSSFQFTDLSNKKIVAGQGLDYFAKLRGNKECTVFFDLDTWKFAYASYHSDDMIELEDGSIVSSRQLLLNMLNYYNNSTIANGNTPIGIEMNGQELDTTWNSLKYDVNKVSVNTSVTEIINNIKKTSNVYTLVPLEEDIDNKLDVTKNEETFTIANLSSKSIFVNKYVQRSTVNINYGFEKYCVTNDGTATVYKAPDNGVCYVKGSGASAEEVIGKNVYYTSLNATPNRDFSESIKSAGLGHSVNSTNATVVDDAKQPYLIDNESCPYEIDGGKLQCSIIVTPDSGTEMHGNDVYVKGGVTAKMYISEELGEDDYVDGKGLVVSTQKVEVSGAGRVKVPVSPQVNGEEEIHITISNKKNGVEEKKIVGIVQSANGEEVTCEKTIYIVDSQCDASCSLEKYEGSESIYEIKSTAKEYYTSLSTDMTWVSLSRDIETEKYLTRVDDRNNETVIYGIVKGSGCYGVCWDAPEIQNLPNCTSSCKPAETGKIKEHCENHWEEDINNYESVDDCITRCSEARSCPEETRDLSVVQSFCNSNYRDLGYNNAAGCINYCYYCPECSSDYIYRPVNNYNPFPNSYDSNTLGFNYPTGDRIIGSNWVGKSSYIKADDSDTTSVTGVQKNQNVEYVIELTPNDIREIRRDTESYNNTTSGNDAYLDYIYMSGVDETGRYYSKFINETIRDKFRIIAGEVVG